jgi:hypothetical protein
MRIKITILSRHGNHGRMKGVGHAAAVVRHRLSSSYFACPFPGVRPSSRERREVEDISQIVLWNGGEMLTESADGYPLQVVQPDTVTA